MQDKWKNCVCVRLVSLLHATGLKYRCPR